MKRTHNPLRLQQLRRQAAIRPKPSDEAAMEEVDDILTDAAQNLALEIQEARQGIREQELRIRLLRAVETNLERGSWEGRDIRILFEEDMLTKEQVDYITKVRGKFNW